MVPIDLGDRLHFEQTEQYSLCCDTPGVPLDETNLVTMAVRSFERRSGRSCDWKISLEKNVPHGAGLGGGSSDAATALLALNELENTGFSSSELASMGAEFGSDVPFFIYQQACMIGGRGEKVEPVNRPDLQGVEILLLKPGFGVSTPDAYKRCLDSEAVDGVNYDPQPMPWGEMVNDLEKPVFYKHRFLAEMKIWLSTQPEVDGAMMSGSGSTMMAFLTDAGDSDTLLVRARQDLDPTLWGQLVKVL